MSHLKEMRDLDPVERGGRDEWGACCWWQGTRRCRCDEPRPEHSATTAAEINNPPREDVHRWEIRQ